MIALAYPRIADLIEAAGTPCFVGGPEKNVPLPFCFVWGRLPIGGPVTLSDADTYVDREFNVTVAAKAPADVLVLASQIQQALEGAVLEVEGWRVYPLRVVDSSNVAVDRVVFNEASNTYPALIVLQVRLQAIKEM